MAADQTPRLQVPLHSIEEISPRLAEDGLHESSLSGDGKIWSHAGHGEDLAGDILIGQNCAKVLNNHRTPRHSTVSTLTSGRRVSKLRAASVDWTVEKNLSALRDLRSLIRTLFWAFENIESKPEPPSNSNHVRPTTMGKSFTSLSIEDAPPPNCVAPCIGRPTVSKAWLQVQLLVRSKAFAAFYLLLTVYALFGPDFLLALGHSPINVADYSLATVNTVVFALFIVEEIILSIGLKGYFGSLRFFMDLCATASLVGDTWIGVEFIKSDAVVAMRSSRMVRLIRGAARATKPGMITQILRLLPRVHDLFGDSATDLAFQLWHKRMMHVFRYLDSECCGVLPRHTAELLNTALTLEFPTNPEVEVWSYGGRVGRWVRDKLPISSRHTLPSCVQASIDAAEQGFMQIAMASLENKSGKLAFKRCKDDLACIQESCAIVESTMFRIVLKICILVLLLLLMMQLLSNPAKESARVQGIIQLIDLAQRPSEVSTSLLCSTVTEQFAYASTQASLLLLVLESRVYWHESCRCCSGAGDTGLSANPLAAGGLVDQVQKATGLEIHETEVVMVEDSSGKYNLAVFDIHHIERAAALESLRLTICVVCLLAGMILYFATDIKRMSASNVLHPLWDLMDDMNAMKLIELLTAGAQPADLERFGLLSRELIGRKRFSKCKLIFAPVPVADELLALRKAVAMLEAAMVSWSKYLPVILLKSLVDAGIEANIGCIPVEVTVFFCDIHGFKAMCEDKNPEEVLSLLSVVLEGVYTALDAHEGTMLEFIGDEVLAVFNAPKPVQDHCRAAVSATLSAIQSIAGIPEHTVRLQCSVHTAQVLAGNIGSPTRMKYGVLGDGVNLAARLKSLNTRYGTSFLASSEVLKAIPNLHETFVVRTIGKLILKGRTTPTHTYEVMSQKSVASARLVAAAGAHETGFEHFAGGRFPEAKAYFEEASLLLGQERAGEGKTFLEDLPSKHFVQLCDQYVKHPPTGPWEGSEHLTKKAW
ncbi:unnamed protein product [Polarella glacialis]|uniref:Guanylate cyclase domain-containing protein n=1 Tax=Polarella glacialis TaxID=89957 RepID=A0A813GXC8_POLGL|nr:unnamed protein product [Polarella glacialis]